MHLLGAAGYLVGGCQTLLHRNPLLYQQLAGAEHLLSRHRLQAAAESGTVLWLSVAEHCRERIEAIHRFVSCSAKMVRSGTKSILVMLPVA